MAEPPITEPRVEPNRRAKRRTPASPTVKLARMSSLTGILFAVLFVRVGFVDRTPTLSASDAEITAFYGGSSTLLVTVGIYLVPLAGIAFLGTRTPLGCSSSPARRPRPPFPTGYSWCPAFSSSFCFSRGRHRQALLRY
jgi:hypothetical protein